MFLVGLQSDRERGVWSRQRLENQIRMLAGSVRGYWFDGCAAASEADTRSTELFLLECEVYNLCEYGDEEIIRAEAARN